MERMGIWRGGGSEMESRRGKRETAAGDLGVGVLWAFSEMNSKQKKKYKEISQRKALPWFSLVPALRVCPPGYRKTAMRSPCCLLFLCAPQSFSPISDVI